MKQKDELFLQLLRDKLDFFIDKSWKELVICKKTFDLDEGFDISCELTKGEIKIVKDYQRIFLLFSSLLIFLQS